jgi:hypothetical protein
MLAEVVYAVIGGDSHRDTHVLETLAPSGATITTLVIDNDDDGFVAAIAGSLNTPQVRGSSSGSRAPVVTASDSPVRCERPASRSSKSDIHGAVIGAAASPIRSMHALPPCRYCA